ncbi:hypothetical protein CB0940_08129 [Cercospora beticola]|uniref:Polyamine aminopropyltransferase n=1 Tax=Cercospora beticola TaxID=122368 RepID=A0A2G5HPL4_CERBT|nr:hypothetical protein CB0940_08129 [Cercospora beticola]PIA94491.1 hypothetical protein CB0940_08129 [Cercospora beticola]WPB04696.1 hypothetical protein RHO25_009343 [Cercospora beticola]
MAKNKKPKPGEASAGDTTKTEDTAQAPARPPQRHTGAHDAPPVQEWEYMYPVALLSLAAAASPISQMTMAPVYGSIPSAVNHATMCSISLLFGFTVRTFTGQLKSFRPLEWVSAWAFTVPVLQTLLLPYSGSLGPVAGPIINGFLSCHMLLLPTGFVLADFVARYKQTAWLASRVGVTAAYMIIGLLLAFPVYSVLEEKYTGIVQWTPELLQEKFEVNPIHFQLALGAAYAVLAPSWYALLGLPAILHSVYFNQHFNIHKANTSLINHNWTLLDRQWSNTGYISVLESTEMEYRVLRADHSLLGGEWLLTPARKQDNWLTNEPIYAVFSMLESVRILQLDAAPVPDTSARALVIGLGIGTAPKALLSHGIETTIVELDPVVHKFAVQYFDLPRNHTAVLQDAVKWVKKQAAAAEALSTIDDNLKDGAMIESNRKPVVLYDYIIHDVFTGGAEPLSLFTTQFLQNLRSLLTPNGAIALNYAGDLSLPLTRLVLRTISHAFDGQCKIFRDGPPERYNENDEKKSENHQEEQSPSSDFLNMVVFCRNSPGQISFRPPTTTDYLGSLSRRHYMLPKPDWEIAFPKHEEEAEALEETASSSPKDDDDPSPATVAVTATPPHANDANAAAEKQDDDAEYKNGKSASDRLSRQQKLLRPGDESSWESEQIESAKRHWRIMRTVMPDVVWETW